MVVADEHPGFCRAVRRRSDIIREISVGIDLGIRGEHVAMIRNVNGDIVKRHVRFTHTTHGLDELWQTIESARHSENDAVRVFLEPTGMSWFPVSQYLQRRGCRVVRVKGKRVGSLRKYLSSHAKTDSVDADVLARMPSFGEAGLQAVHVPSASQFALKRCVKQRARHVEDMSNIKRRLRALVRWAQPRWEAAMDGEVMTTMARALLRRYFNPYAMRGLGARRLAAFLRSHVAGRQSRILDQTAPIVQPLLATADDAIALYGTQHHVDFALLQTEIVRDLDVCDALERSVRQLDEEIATLSEQTGMASLLESIPGVADVTASAGSSKCTRDGHFKVYRSVHWYNDGTFVVGAWSPSDWCSKIWKTREGTSDHAGVGPVGQKPGPSARSCPRLEA